MSNTFLNITNGEYFNRHLSSISKDLTIPFNEVLMDGEVDEIIFSDRFIRLRLDALKVTELEYKEKIKPFLQLDLNYYRQITLWFGLDTFCQANLLTLLAYFEQKNYKGKVIINYVDDESFNVVNENIQVELGIYRKIYNDVLISKKRPNEYGVINKNAIDLYFDYHSNQGKLAKLVKDNNHKNKSELLVLLVLNSKEYGLSDLQAEKLINEYL